ncbi:substrate-binding periplasmic protein [Thalassomonas actiniarum]|uniref:Transporter substrate-binding domain-containing protein n=1 Tax=Thalassomonas actiniarum TaxID=485447 RepID=A0AAF0BX70_9GAMM|nr:transporter substrate-binding domain-containing protein [Thalassomonas actiniarum]WDD96936.1 transporter substrate-binding domain-containing protein [Thalassomonas actiniarum]
MKIQDFFLGLLMALSAAFNSLAQETIRITTGEYPPYYSQKLTNYGPIPDIVIQAFAHANIKVEFGFFPWSRSLELAKSNHWDASCCWFDTSQWYEYFNYSDVLVSRDKIFFHLKSYPFDWQSYEDLKGIKIGATARHAYGEKFAAANKTGKLLIEDAPTNAMNLKKLFAGRINIFPIERQVGYQLLADLFTPEETQLFTHHPKILFSGRVRLLISKKNPKSQYFMKKFNQGLKMLKESGEYEQLFIKARQGDK